MNGLVLNEGGYVTYPYKIFKVIESYVRGLNWRISNMEFGGVHPYPFECGKDIVIDGDSLFETVKSHYGTQWIWGVLSGFPKKMASDEIRQSTVIDISIEQPYLQNGLHHIQDSAVLEIVAFDSTATYVLFDDERLKDILTDAFPHAEGLEKQRTMDIHEEGEWL